MTELDLYKFITNNEVEWHKTHYGLEWLKTHYDYGSQTEVVIFVNLWDIKEFGELFGSDGIVTDYEGIPCYLKEGRIAFEMANICDYYDIDINKIFVGENYDS
jgi:hypothetical protein